MYHKKLGRVHWFLFNLDPFIKRHFRISYDYARHNYLLYRPYVFKPYDLYAVQRTSKHCFRLVYVNFVQFDVFFQSFRTSKQCADFIFSHAVSTSLARPP